MKEIWKDIYYVDSISEKIIDYKGLYQISNIGRVRSLNRITRDGRNIKGRILSLKLTKDGYHNVTLTVNGIKCYRVNRLVAHMFIPNPENKPEVDHINTIRTDNRVQNLRWVTGKENHNNPLSIINHSNIMKESKNEVVEYVDGEIINIFHGQGEASRFTGFKQSGISQCCNGKRNSNGKINDIPVKWKHLKDTSDDDLIRYLIKLIINKYE